MTKIHLQLPEKVKAAAESRAAAVHSTVDAYVESLIIADGAEDFGVPDHLNVGSREQLITLLREGQTSPASEMTANDWDAMRKRLLAQHAPSKVG